MAYFLSTTTMLNHEHYRGLLSRVKTRRRRLPVSRAASEQSSESYTSYGLGSGTNGTVISVISCSNSSEGDFACHNEGLLGCAQAIYFLPINVPETNYISYQCSLVKVAPILMTLIALTYH